MNRLYLDACSIIYLVETASPFHKKVVARLLAHGADPDARLLTSRLSRLECRVRPLRDGNVALLSSYEAFFSASRLLLVEVTPAILERATELRAQHGFRTPDAIHLASALEERADAFLTGDSSLARCPGLRVEVLQPS